MAYTKDQLLAYLINKVRSAGIGGLTTAQDLRMFLEEVINSLFAGDEANSENLSELLEGYITLDTSQTVSGEKLFTTLPESSIAPTTGNQLTNKTYVDAEIAEALGEAGEIPFDSNRPITRETPGIQGVNLNKASLVDTITELLYPLTAPRLTMTQSFDKHEYGNTGPVVLNWNVEKVSETITGITVAGVVISPTGNTQSGTTNKTLSATANTTLTLVAITANTSRNLSLVNTVSSKIRVGFLSKDGTIDVISDSDINSLPNFFATDFSLTTNVTFPVPADNYLVIAYPSSFSNPLIKINGFSWSDYNKPRDNSAFVNTFGYSENFDVIVSNNQIAGLTIVQLLNP